MLKNKKKEKNQISGTQGEMLRLGFLKLPIELEKKMLVDGIHFWSQVKARSNLEDSIHWIALKNYLKETNKKKHETQCLDNKHSWRRKTLSLRKVGEEEKEEERNQGKQQMKIV